MKHLVVQESSIGGWDVLDADAGYEPLYHSDRIRAEGFARQYSQKRGGEVTVVGHNGLTLAQYAVNAWKRAAPYDVDSGRRSRGRRR